jgi:dipeptidyl aminopeptidase/acylaminoacyl peptidase
MTRLRRRRAHLQLLLTSSVALGCAHARATAGDPVAWVVAAEAEARTEELTPEDVVQTRIVTDVELSPDGAHVAYVLRVPRPLDDSGPPRSQIWLVKTTGGEAPRRLTPEKESSSSPRWSADGTTLAFVSKRSGDEHAEIYVLPVAGGEAQRVAALPAAPEKFAFSPDGKRIAWSGVVVSPQVAAARKGGRDAVVDEGGGDLTGLQVLDLASGSSRELPMQANVLDFEWAPDGRALVARVSARNSVDHGMMYSSLVRVDAGGGAPVPLTRTEGKLGAFAFSPDGKHLAFLGASDLNDPTPGIVYVVAAAGGPAKALTADEPFTAVWVGWRSASTLIVGTHEGTRARLRELQASHSGAGRVLFESRAGESAVACNDVTLVADKVACAGESGLHPPEVYVGSLQHGRLARVTVSNPDLQRRRLGRQEVVRWKHADGTELEGVLVHPVDADPARRAPLVVLAHGGPEGVSLDGWGTRALYPVQLLAARGYAVLQPNYRGSSGRGVAFGKADHGDLGGKEFEDVLAGIDALAQQGIVDPERVAIAGWSYGGYFSGLAATVASRRFKAAVVGAAITDWISFTGTTEIEHENSLVHWKLWPWDDPKLPWERSPVAHVRGSTTATMVVHGLADSRVPPGQATELYRALQRHKVPSTLVLYPREGHGLAENVHQLDYLERVLAWFRTHLGGR